MRKFKCIKSYESGEWLTKGKIYTEDNGKFRYDDGWVDTTFDYDTAHFDSDNKLSDYLEEIKEDKKVGKFKVGDVVEIIGNKSGHCFNIGDIVELYAYDRKNEDFRARTNKNEYDCNWVRMEELELVDDVKSSTSKTFTITTSDTTTTLTDGTHITTINRYYTDKHDDMVALEEVVKKYKSEMEEIERKSKEPKVGDKVRIIDHRKTHSRYDEWLIKNNVNLKSAIKWRNGLSPKNGGEYIIKEIHKLTYSSIDLALIEDKKNAYIINIEGLEVVK